MKTRQRRGCPILLNQEAPPLPELDSWPWRCSVGSSTSSSTRVASDLFFPYRSGPPTGSRTICRARLRSKLPSPVRSSLPTTTTGSSSRLLSSSDDARIKLTTISGLSMIPV